MEQVYETLRTAAEQVQTLLMYYRATGQEGHQAQPATIVTRQLQSTIRALEALVEKVGERFERTEQRLSQTRDSLHRRRQEMLEMNGNIEELCQQMTTLEESQEQLKEQVTRLAAREEIQTEYYIDLEIRLRQLERSGARTPPEDEPPAQRRRLNPDE